MKAIIKFLVVTMLISIAFIPSFANADQVHRVAAGETFYSIATKYGTTPKALINNNPFVSNPNVLFRNQVLIIPNTDQENIYYVKQGDSLYKISQKLGVSMEALAEANKLNNWNSLYVGQSLSVPSNITNNYSVKQGDTLYTISQKLGVSVNALAQENKLTNVNYLYVGQVLRLPSSNTSTNPNTNPSTSPSTKPSPEVGFRVTNEALVKKYPDTFYLKGASNLRRISLTFDDGPDEVYTPQVLDILKAHNVKATFFLVGSKVQKHPEITRRILREGHTIGNHTWTHPDLRKASSEELLSEIKSTEAAIREATGLTTAIMRPPFGAVNERVIEQLRGLDYKVINWNVDSVDWQEGITADQILINSLPTIKRDAILLMHDAYGDKSATVKALDELITTLKLNGYDFVTVDKMLNLRAYK